MTSRFEQKQWLMALMQGENWRLAKFFNFLLMLFIELVKNGDNKGEIVDEIKRMHSASIQ